MVKKTVLQLPDWAGEEIEKMAERKGHPFVTVVRDLVIESLDKNAPGATSAKINEPGAARSS